MRITIRIKFLSPQEGLYSMTVLLVKNAFILQRAFKLTNPIKHL